MKGVELESSSSTTIRRSCPHGALPSYVSSPRVVITASTRSVVSLPLTLWEFHFGTQVCVNFASGIEFPAASYIPQSTMNRKMTRSLLPKACLTDLLCGAHRQYQLFFLLTAKIIQQLGRKKKNSMNYGKSLGRENGTTMGGKSDNSLWPPIEVPASNLNQFKEN